MPDPIVKDLRPDEAARLLQDDPNTLLIDVRSRMEYDYVGHPVGAIHVAWMEPPEWRVLPDFVDRVHRVLETRAAARAEDTPILTLCRSGARSRAAAQTLAQEGFTRVFNVAEGFEGDRDADGHRSSVSGWRFRDLPWEQS
ncbi:MAG: rhodanese-like domain-containing protein [Gammaproteobacteria bacterium]